jgi:hypothetical protein
MTSSNTPKETTEILLLGAGELGTAFLSHITSLPNTHVTVGVRSPHNYPHLASPTVTLLALDLTNPSTTITEVFARYNVIISATGFTSTPSSLSKLANEVLSAGRLRASLGKPKLWFFPWQWGVDYDVTGDGNGLMPLFGEQKKVRDLLRTEAEGSGVRWTIVSTGIFMSFLFEPFWGIVEQSSQNKEEARGEGGRGGRGGVVVRCLRDWEHGVTVTDVHDIGRVLKRILAGEVEAENRVVYVAGDSVTYGKLADIVERVIGRIVAREVWSVEHLQEELKRDPENGIKKYRLVFAGDGVWWEKEKTVNHDLGMDMTDVKTYAKKVFGVRE